MAEELKHLRVKHRLTQESVAEHLGITQPAYSDYERGKKVPPLERLMGLAQLYGLPLEHLIGLMPKPKQPDPLPGAAALHEHGHLNGQLLATALHALDRLQAELATLRDKLRHALGGGGR